MMFGLMRVRTHDAEMARYHIARFVIHAGIAIMPSGRAKAELYQLLDCWATKVRKSNLADRKAVSNG